MVAGTPSNVIDPIGPGLLFVSALDFTGLDLAADRTDFVADPATPITGLRKIGYTDAGHETTSSTTTEPVEVAEEVDELDNLVTKRVTGLKLTMAEPTLKNLAWSLGAGADVANPDPGDGWEPPSVGDMVATTMWHLTESGALWRYWRARPDGDMTIAAAKAPNKRMIPLNVKLGAGPTGKPFIVYPDAAGLV